MLRPVARRPLSSWAKLPPQESEHGSGNEFEIYLYRVGDGFLVNLTQHAGDDRLPTWSPDGTRLAFQSNRDGNEEIYSMSVDGSDQVNLTNDPAMDTQPAWSRN